MKPHRWIAAALLVLATLGTGAGLAAWKLDDLQSAAAAAARQPEHVEAITVAVAETRQHRQTVTAIGTVLALRSVTLRNELPGTIEEVALTPGQIVDAGTVLVRLDVAVEQAELVAQQARAELAQTQLERNQQASLNRAVSDIEVDRARAERDVALAEIERTKAIIARKTIRAPFRARIGLSDVHVGQYLDEGTELTTLQSVDDAVHVDFAVAQAVAATLREGSTVEVFAGTSSPVTARVVAVDARVDPTTRNALIRARVERAAVAPGASVRVQVPVGPARTAVAVPVSALRKGPGGDHVFVVVPDPAGDTRAQLRPVVSGTADAGVVLIHDGLTAGERVAASGSFKLYEGMLVAVIDPQAPADNAVTH